MDIFGTERATLRAEARAAADIARMMARQYNELMAKYNRLVGTINNKGGQAFLDNGVLPRSQPQQFTPDEIESLIRLCHPDKHGNSEAANRLTQRLLGMRKK